MTLGWSQNHFSKRGLAETALKHEKRATALTTDLLEMEQKNLLLLNCLWISSREPHRKPVSPARETSFWKRREEGAQPWG